MNPAKFIVESETREDLAIRYLLPLQLAGGCLYNACGLTLSREESQLGAEQSYIALSRPREHAHVHV